MRLISNKVLNKNFIYNLDKEKNYLALEYNEGINLNRRSDIAWLQNDLIDKGKILIYFTSLDITNNSKKISKKILDEIRGMNITPVCLKAGIMNERNFPVWSPPTKGIIPNPNISINNP